MRVADTKLWTLRTLAALVLIVTIPGAIGVLLWAGVASLWLGATSKTASEFGMLAATLAIAVFLIGTTVVALRQFLRGRFGWGFGLSAPALGVYACLLAGWLGLATL